MSAPATTAQAWTIDPAHSDITFKVRHLAISTVTGHFKTFDGTLNQPGADLTSASVSFHADVNSVNTNNDQRDEHLRSQDFFGAAEHPKLSFESTKIEKSGDHYKLHGKLSIKGHTHEVVLDVTEGGTVNDGYGNVRRGYEVSGKLSRKDFGLTWSALTEAGVLVVSDEVKLDLNVQFMAKA